MRIVLVGLLFATFVSLAGCVVGLRSVATDVGEPAGQKRSLKDLKVAYSADHDMLRLALERALIESYHVRDLLPVQDLKGREAGDRISITASISPHSSSTLSNVCFALSYFSFSMIPCIMEETSDVVLSANVQDRVVLEKTYRITTRTYNWLPLSLTGSDYSFFILDGGDPDQQPKELAAYGQIVRDFLPRLAHSPERPL